MNEGEFKIEKKKPGPKTKYLTEDERKKAAREASKRYYEKNKDKCNKKQSEKSKKIYELLKKYNEGKLVEI